MNKCVLKGYFPKGWEKDMIWKELRLTSNRELVGKEYHHSIRFPDLVKSQKNHGWIFPVKVRVTITEIK